MNIEEFLALPYAQSIRLVVGPNITDEVFIDRAVFEERQEELVRFCRGLPHINDGPSWQMLKVHTGGNGMLAKTLIALGEVAEVWRMHPNPRFPELWHNRMYPMVLAGSVQAGVSPRAVPKPSVGDLDSETHCVCCSRPMGSSDSWKHDLTASAIIPELCYECEEEECDPPDEPCKLGFDRAENSGAIVKLAEEDEVPGGLEEYLKKFD